VVLTRPTTRSRSYIVSSSGSEYIANKFEGFTEATAVEGEAMYNLSYSIHERSSQVSAAGTST